MDWNTVPSPAPEERLEELLGHRGAATAELLLILSGGAMRFGALRAQTRAVSQKTLVAELRSLERAGAVERVVFAEIPPRVEYSLTEAGRELLPLLQELKDWCERRTGEEER